MSGRSEGRKKGTPESGSGEGDTSAHQADNAGKSRHSPKTENDLRWWEKGEGEAPNHRLPADQPGLHWPGGKAWLLVLAGAPGLARHRCPSALPAAAGAFVKCPAPEPCAWGDPSCAVPCQPSSEGPGTAQRSHRDYPVQLCGSARLRQVQAAGPSSPRGSPASWGPGMGHSGTQARRGSPIWKRQPSGVSNKEEETTGRRDTCHFSSPPMSQDRCAGTGRTFSERDHLCHREPRDF